MSGKQDDVSQCCPVLTSGRRLGPRALILRFMLHSVERHSERDNLAAEEKRRISIGLDGTHEACILAEVTRRPSAVIRRARWKRMCITVQDTSSHRSSRVEQWFSRMVLRIKFISKQRVGV
jgi:hypothetical protein